MMNNDDQNTRPDAQDDSFDRIRPLFNAQALIKQLRQRAAEHAPKTPEELEASHAKWEAARATQYRRYGWTKPRR
ncbi:MAG: hypothetical protein C7B46_12730 [Sulfobacillus benefaciens]|uniref:Uncharacterized protein n=1 Tax=Sulfobacillus benefaciens TaxID=453960 RepID=A0A2T2XEC1_9FIRM|nr:MAG: hypothetical protein C7B46_12730 [Sulfobacillus benefaciens]